MYGSNETNTLSKYEFVDMIKNDLKEENGYKVRLITYDELTDIGYKSRLWGTQYVYYLILIHFVLQIYKNFGLNMGVSEYH